MYEIQQVETILYAVQQAPKAAGCKIVQTRTCRKVENRTAPPPHNPCRAGVKCSPSPENLPILAVLWCV